MRIFIVIARSDTNLADLREAIAGAFPDQHLLLSEATWAVAREAGTTEEVSHALEISPNGRHGGALVVAIDGYFGFAPGSVWNWLAARQTGLVGA